MATFAMRMDDDFKKDFEAVCEELGCDIPTVIRMLGEKMIRERRIPFDIDADPFQSAENPAHLQRSIAQLEAGRSRRHALIDAED